MNNQDYSSPVHKNIPVIEMSGVWRVYTMGDNEVQALRGISFSVERGEFMSIMGPSG